MLFLRQYPTSHKQNVKLILNIVITFLKKKGKNIRIMFSFFNVKILMYGFYCNWKKKKDLRLSVEITKVSGSILHCNTRLFKVQCSSALLFHK